MPFNISDQDNVSNVLTHIDIIIQYADTREPKDRVMDEAESSMAEQAATIKDLHI